MPYLFDVDRQDIQAYRGKSKECECGKLIYFETRFDDSGWVVTKDGERPNGKDYPDSNVKWFCMNSLTKDDHDCPVFKERLSLSSDDSKPKHIVEKCWYCGNSFVDYEEHKMCDECWAKH